MARKPERYELAPYRGQRGPMLGPLYRDLRHESLGGGVQAEALSQGEVLEAKQQADIGLGIHAAPEGVLAGREQGNHAFPMPERRGGEREKLLDLPDAERGHCA